MGDENNNNMEWADLNNWSHPTFGLYFSKRDRRVWVPKKIGVGWTLNMGHPHSAWWFAGLFIVTSWLAFRLGARRK